MGTLFKDQAVNQRVNINVSGGGDVAKYYLSTTYTKDRGILKVDDRNDYNSGINLNKFQVRSNNIINITRKLEARIQTYIAVDNYTGPLDGAQDLYRKIGNTSPTRFPAYFEPDQANIYNPNILFGNYAQDGSATYAPGDLYVNPYAESIKGYRDYSRSKLNAQINLKQIITDEVSLRAKVGYDRNSYFQLKREIKPAYYNVSNYDEFNDTYTLHLLNNEDNNPEDALSFSGSDPNVSSVLYAEFAADYNKTFNEVHDLQGLLVLNLRERQDNNAKENSAGTELQNSLPSRNLGLAGRLSYGYKSKYFAEFVFGYNGSERFAKKERFGYFPSLGFGWNISKENFWKKLKPVVNDFKITTTYGLVGNDDVSAQRFYYLSQVNLNANGRGAVFGENFINNTGVAISKYANDKITWETAKKFNLGLQLALFKNKIEFNADYFSEIRENIFTRRSGLPASLGLVASIEGNSGKAKSHGVEFNVKLRENWGKDWWFQGTGNFTFATSEYLEYDEVDYSATPWRSRIGNRINQTYGYVAERLFIDEYDVANSPEQQFARGYGPGDIKYKDINNDGIIDQSDIVPIGTSGKPEINYGFGFSFGYKGFDFNCFFNGIANRTFFINPVTTAPFIDSTIDGMRGERNLLKVYADNHWSEENRDIYALWPRLSTEAVPNNTAGGENSTWFMRDGALMRLKQLELGYTFPDNFLGSAIDNVRFYVSGTNLFTLSKFDLWDVELGGTAFNYPIQRVYNIGLRANF